MAPTGVTGIAKHASFLPPFVRNRQLFRRKRLYQPSPADRPAFATTLLRFILDSGQTRCILFADLSDDHQGYALGELENRGGVMGMGMERVWLQRFDPLLTLLSLIHHHWRSSPVACLGISGGAAEDAGSFLDNLLSA
jgi:hypothetical protein